MVKNFKTKTIRLLVLSILCLNFLGILLINFPTALAQEEKFETLYFTPQIEIPFSAISGRTAVGSPDKDGFIVSDLLARYIKAMYDYGIMIGGILAALMLMAGGIIWLTSAGDSGKVTKAKSIIAGSITGVVILMGAYFILNTINPDLVQMKGVEMIVTQNIDVAKTICCHETKGRLEFNTRKVGNDLYYYEGEKDGQRFLGCQAEASAVDCSFGGGCFKYGGEHYQCYSKKNVCCGCRIGNPSRQDSICARGVTEEECNTLCNEYSENSQEGKTIHYTLNISMPPAELFHCAKKSDTYSICEEIK